jgi:hypothetical protein
MKMNKLRNFFSPSVVYSNVKWIVLILVLGAVCYTCQPSPNFPIVPVITFKSVNKTYINQQTDSLQLVFSFTDGDGDLGLTQSDTSTDALVIDHRPDPLHKDYDYTYRIPFITPGGQVKDISGDITITLPGVTCMPNKTLDTVIYEIKIKDRAGHWSNLIQSPSITVNCQ